MIKRILATFSLIFLSNFSTSAQQTSSPKFEFRGAWIATVLNLDFPTSPLLSTYDQQAELRKMFDQFSAMGINAVFFQVRSECDAMYDSKIEPWSYYLTGQQGKAPEPFWDPLKFAIDLAHERGMELHAWINPFRAIKISTKPYKKALNHVSVTHPEWLLKTGDILLDPGIPDAREYIMSVVMDIVKRYDIDGIHYDDYFYPYDDITRNNEDKLTFEKYGKPMGFTDIRLWRTNNINMFVKMLGERIQKEKPFIKHGISPFGIYKNGTPVGTSGFDAANILFTDPPTWLRDKSIDYLVPQLYWAFGGAQDYAKLAPWWASIMNGRHLYVGHGLYREGTIPLDFSPNEIPRQVRFNRANNIVGSVFYRALNLTNNAGGFADTLSQKLYKVPALTPSMSWKDQRPPLYPEHVAFKVQQHEVTLTWERPELRERNVEARRFAIYRVESQNVPNFKELTSDSKYLVAVTGQTTFKETVPNTTKTFYYLVSSISANSIEAWDDDNIVKITDTGVANEPVTEAPSLSLSQNFPNPFSESTEIRFDLDKAAFVTLRIYNSLGQEVKTFLNNNQIEAGMHTQTWDGTNANGQKVSSGLYLCVLEANGKRATKMMVKQ
jgi:uncharacterized lipoprotein YddW (UPF0748 family)